MTKDNKELSEQEKKAIITAYAKETLNSDWITNIAAAGYTQVPEGQFSRYGTIFTELFNKTTDIAPSQREYDAVLKKSLQSNVGGLNRTSLMNDAVGVINRALLALPVNYIREKMGLDSNATYGGKDVSELSDEARKLIQGAYGMYLADEKAEKFFKQEKTEIADGLDKGLEEILKGSDKKK